MRLQADTALLAVIAKESLPVLKRQRQKCGRPSKVERDRRFVALAQSRDTTMSSSRSKKADVAWTAWQICFDDMKAASGGALLSVKRLAMATRSEAVGRAMNIESLDAEKQIVTRHGRRDRQGQKA